MDQRRRKPSRDDSCVSTASQATPMRPVPAHIKRPAYAATGKGPEILTLSMEDA